MYRGSFGWTIQAVCVLTAFVLTSPAAAQRLVIGDDNKVDWNDLGQSLFGAPGKDEVVVIDIADKETPKIVTSIPLANSIAGPPTNLAITPDGAIALVANSMAGEPDGDRWKPTPDTKIFVIDLESAPPKLLTTIDGPRQPSGMAIRKDGALALVANRVDASISVLKIKGRDVKLIGVVPMGDPVAAVAISPDGKHALAVKNTVNKVAYLTIEGDSVTYDKRDSSVGVFPYNVQITADGRWGLVANQGNGGVADGGAGSIAVIDMTLSPPRVVDYVTVGPAPEGLAVSPTAPIAVSLGLNGSGAVPKNAWYAKPFSTVDVLSTGADGVKNIATLKAGRMAEGLSFSPDGQFLYVANFSDKNLQIFRVRGMQIEDTGKVLALPGRPASMRSSAP